MTQCPLHVSFLAESKLIDSPSRADGAATVNQFDADSLNYVLITNILKMKHAHQEVTGFFVVIPRYHMIQTLM